VRAILERGAVPVLSPFIPDPATPMAASRPPSTEDTIEVFLRATELADELGGMLGPDCVPCMHNTLTLPNFGPQPISGYAHHVPALTSGV
jgi:hypothetical protein